MRDVVQSADLINQTLNGIYNEYENSYRDAASEYGFDSGPADIPYAYWHFLGIKYVGEDFVSILYNDIEYMGGAHPYSRFDAITIDCKTGREVSVLQLTGETEDCILAEISNKMGLEVTGTWDDIDYYLTDSEIVFFYRIPGKWEEVVLKVEEMGKKESCRNNIYCGSFLFLPGCGGHCIFCVSEDFLFFSWQV